MHGCLRGRHEPPHDRASRDEPSMWTTHFAGSAVQPHQRNGSAHVPAGTPQCSGCERYRDLCGGSGLRIEELAGLKHRMHYNRHFARHSHGSSFEAESLPELQTPRAQSAVG